MQIASERRNSTGSNNSRRNSRTSKVEQREDALLAWRITVKATGFDKVLLDDVAGQLLPGSLVAIMGPSGSGKTTLLNVLACRTPRGSETFGEALLFGRPYKAAQLKSVSGYVPQDDLLNGNLTVYETLHYTAHLRLDPALSDHDKDERVEEIMTMMGLAHARNTVIGTALKKGISGGERKRVCVGMELLESPQLLFLDEPTSGLDSATALGLCSTLRDLARELNMAVIMTIHQPQTKVFDMFDQLIIMKNGKQIFNGTPNDAVTAWEASGYPLPEHTNPAEFLLSTITPSMGEDKEALKHVDDALAKRVAQPLVNLVQNDDRPLPLRKRTSWVTQFRILMRRHLKEQRRRMGTFLITTLQNLILAVLVGTVYLKIGDTQKSTVFRLPVLFFCAINQGFLGATNVVNSFPAERTLTLRERAAGTYYISAYYMAKVVAETLTSIHNPIIYAVVVYFLAGLQLGADKFFLFLLFNILCNWSAVSMALMISAFARTTAVAVTILPFFLEVCRLMGGYYLSPANLPVYFVWLDALSYVKYAYTGMALNELSGLRLSCTAKELPASGICPITTGEQTIRAQGFDYLTIGECIAILVCYIFICRVAAFIGMRFIKH